MRKLFLLFLIFSLASCADSTTMDIPPDPDFKGDFRVLILGNSFTWHPPAPGIGWNGNWGMAASSEQNDYVHVLTDAFTSHFPSATVSVTARNLYNWEQDFSTDPAQFNIPEHPYDLIICRLGENVNTQAETFDTFPDELGKLVNRYKSGKTKVVVTGSLWRSSRRDRRLKETAEDGDFAYISLVSFRKDSSRYAFGQFSNAHVRKHLSDKGMKALADTLFLESVKLLAK